MKVSGQGSSCLHALVAGWFSFKGHGHATAGDLLAAEITCDWLSQAGFSYDLATDEPFSGGIDWRQVSAEDYSHVVFVCGPFGRSHVTEEFMRHFNGCRIIGLNLTMNQPIRDWNPFDFLIERNNSSREGQDITRPDMTFLSSRRLVPVVGVCLVERYGAKHENDAYAAIKRLIASREMSIVQIDTRLDENKTGLSSPAQVESILSRMDLVITTRLHGTVLSIKNGVPVIAIDPGGDSNKIKRLADKIGWPHAFMAGHTDDRELEAALQCCLSDEGKQKAEECRQRALSLAGEFQTLFLTALLGSIEKCRISGAEVTDENDRTRIVANIERKLDW